MFSINRRPYDHIVGSLNYEIDRNARLIEALRRLPPMIREIETEIVPDSLLLIVVWQLCCCIWVSGKATSIDSTLG